MASDDQRMFRIHDAPKSVISTADFQRMMLKKAKTQALARAVETARHRQTSDHGAERNPQGEQGELGAAEPNGSGGRDSHTDSPQPMAVDGVPDYAAAAAAESEERQPGGGAAASEQQPSDEAKQQKEAHAAALQQRLVQSRKQALSQRRREEHEAEDAAKLR